MTKPAIFSKFHFFSIIFLAFLFIFSAVSIASADTEVKIFVDGQQISFDSAPVIIDGTTLAPMRAIFEAIGSDVQWDQATKTATGTKDGKVVSVQIGNEYGYKGGEAIKLLQPAQLINSRTMVPLRFISESLDCDVQWDGNSKTITITTDGTSSAPPTTPPASETTSQKNAVAKAKSYLNVSAFSHAGLVSQLEYEKFSHADAVYGVDHCGADWNEQALKKAKNYLNVSAFSYQGLLDQLLFEEFTEEQATYGVNNCGADWNEQASKKAEQYLSIMSFSREGLIDQLEFEGFTHEQAVYGAAANGY